MATPNRKLISGRLLAREVANALERAAIPRPAGSDAGTGTYTYGADIKTFRFPPKPIFCIVVRPNFTPMGPGEVISHPHLTIYVRGKTVKDVAPVVDRIYELADRGNFGGLDTLVGMFWPDAGSSDEPYWDEHSFAVIPAGFSGWVQRKLVAAA